VTNLIFILWWFACDLHLQIDLPCLFSSPSVARS